MTDMTTAVYLVRFLGSEFGYSEQYLKLPNMLRIRCVHFGLRQTYSTLRLQDSSVESLSTPHGNTDKCMESPGKFFQ
jgi:hypothetical protein